MVGLRTHENSKFIAFFRLVQKAADSMEKVFFLIAEKEINLKMKRLNVKTFPAGLLAKRKRRNLGKSLMQMKRYQKSGTIAERLLVGSLSTDNLKYHLNEVA